MRNIVFDLEHTLIDNIRGGNPAPDARKILKRAGKDFDKVYLWTSCLYDDTLDILYKLNFRGYFDGILSTGFLPLQKLPEIFLIGRDGNELVKTLPLKSPVKDLALLGNPKYYVIIEDTLPLGKSLAVPQDRVIEIMPLGYSIETGRLASDLSRGYQKALERFS